jgi:hypothetical protein
MPESQQQIERRRENEALGLTLPGAEETETDRELLADAAQKPAEKPEPSFEQTGGLSLQESSRPEAEPEGLTGTPDYEGGPEAEPEEMPGAGADAGEPEEDMGAKAMSTAASLATLPARLKMAAIGIGVFLAFIIIVTIIGSISYCKFNKLECAKMLATSVYNMLFGDIFGKL